MLRTVVAFLFVFTLLGASQSCVSANFIVGGDFENQAVFQNLPHYQLGPNSEKWGRSWNGDWTPSGLESSWRAITPGGDWGGTGAICRTEDFASGWKWARSGEVFGVLAVSNTLTQTFTATNTETLQLSWYDANRNSWRTDTWFGREASYQVSITDVAADTTVAEGDYTSQVYGGSDVNSQNNASDDRFLLANRKGWFSKSLVAFNVVAGKQYTVSFTGTNSEDRTTLLDDVSLVSAVPEPSSLGLLSLGAIGCAFLRRRRQQG